MRVGIYVRVSTRDKGQDVNNQLDQLLSFCSTKGWDVYKVYTDNESGSKGRASRAGFDAMFKDAYQRKFDLLLVWALDRFTREGMFKTIAYLQKLDTYGVRFWSYMDEGLNTDNELARNIVLAILSSFAKMERQRISERTKAGLERARKRGKVLGGRPLAFAKRERIKKLYKDKKTPYRIAKEMGISINTVKKYIRQWKESGDL